MWEWTCGNGHAGMGMCEWARGNGHVGMRVGGTGVWGTGVWGWECGAWACIVVPRWPSQHWWVELMSMTLHVVEFPPHSPSFERIVDGQWQTVEQSSFRAMAVVVDGRMGQPAHQ